jgi:hypothetical protein
MSQHEEGLLGRMRAMSCGGRRIGLAAVVLALLALMPRPTHAYIAVSAERLTLPEVILEFKAVAVLSVQKSDPARGAVRFKLESELVGKLPADASLKHSIAAEGKAVPGVGELTSGETVILFWGSFDRRSLVLTQRGWYQTRAPGGGDDGWERYTQRRDDMARVFVGTPKELRAAIEAMLRGQRVVASIVPKTAQGNERLAVGYDLLDPHRRHAPELKQGAKIVASERAVPGLVRDLSSVTAGRRQQVAYGLIDHAAVAHSAVPALLGAMKDPHLEIRAAAIDAIGHIAHLPPKATGKPAYAMDDVVRALAEALKDEDRFVAASAARALARLGPAARPALSALGDALPDRNADFDFRPLRALEAARAILMIDPAAPQADAAVRLLTGDKLLNDDRADGYGTRLAGAIALADTGVGAKSAEGELLKRMRDDKLPEVRIACAEAILRIDANHAAAADAIKVLSGGVAADDVLTRVRALRSIARAGAAARPAAESARARLKDPMEAVRQAAEEAVQAAK